MNVLVVFPKKECYINKPLSTQRVLREKFVKYLTLLKDAKCGIDILLEDSLAYDFCHELGIKPRVMYTCITNSDLEWIKRYPEMGDVSSRILADYPLAEKMVYDSDTKYLVPTSLMREGTMVYVRKRIDAYHKKYIYAINRLLRDTKNVLQFRVDNNMDRGAAIHTSVTEGDGRLCIEVGLNTGVSTVYYGGTYIQEDLLPTILTL